MLITGIRNRAVNVDGTPDGPVETYKNQQLNWWTITSTIREASAQEQQ